MKDFQVHRMVFLGILFLRERVISFQPVLGVAQWGRLAGLWDLCHYTPSHMPSGRCLRCLVEDRSLSPTVQSHYGLTVTPSFLLGGSQDGIKRVCYRRICQALAHKEQRHVHVSVHTHVTCRTRAGMDAQLFSIDGVSFFQTQFSLPCLSWHVINRLGGFISERWEFITIRKKPLCLLPLSVNAQNLYSFISAASVHPEFGTVAHHHCRTWYISIKD